MGYDRYDRPDHSPRDGDYRDRDRGSAHDYRADRDRSGYGAGGGSRGPTGGFGQDDYRERSSGSRDYYGASRQDFGRDRGDYGADRARGSNFGRDDGRGGYRGGHDGPRFAERQDRDRRPDQDADDDRGFLARAGDEVRSWFGDEEAERRRERDQRYDEQMARYDERSGDHAYRSWRDTQVSAFDRDYDEYRQENATKFQSEFAAFRTERQSQRDSLTQVREHMEVFGSDGEHVGVVDKVRGDRIILTKNDADANGHHHSIPSRWVGKVDDKVTLRKTRAEAQQAWRDEDQGQAMFGSQQGGRQYGQDRFGQQGQRGGAQSTTGQALDAGTSTTAGTGVSHGDATGAPRGDGGTNLNRSFSGTY